MHAASEERSHRAFRRAARRTVVAVGAVLMGMTLMSGGVTMLLSARMPSAMARPKIDLYEVRGEPTDAVRQASREELQDAVRAFLEGWDRHPFVDGEVVWLASIGVGKAGAAGMDTAVGAWLGDAPSDKRRGIAAAFLEGYWPWAQSADAAVVEAMLGSLPAIERDDEAYGASLRALAGVIGERSGLSLVNRARVRQELLRRRAELIAEQRLEGTVAVLDALVPR